MRPVWPHAQQQDSKSGNPCGPVPIFGSWARTSLAAPAAARRLAGPTSSFPVAGFGAAMPSESAPAAGFGAAFADFSFGRPPEGALVPTVCALMRPVWPHAQQQGSKSGNPCAADPGSGFTRFGRAQPGRIPADPAETSGQKKTPRSKDRGVTWAASKTMQRYFPMCPKWDSNPHTSRYCILSAARLPIPPFGPVLRRESQVHNPCWARIYSTCG